MGARNDIDGLISFISREDVWHERMMGVLDEHLMPALEEFDVDYDELVDILGEPWPNVLWGCGFEDFLGRRYSPDGQNIIDLYLKRRGWKETALNRAYLEGLRDAPVSLYEVSTVKSGESMVLRDLLMDTDPVTVWEKSATRSLKQWDRIAVRVVPERNCHVISGALLAFSAEAVELLLSELRRALKLPAGKELRLTADRLRGCAPIFANAWLFSALPRALDPALPKLCNSDDDDVIFHELRFPLVTGVAQKDVAIRLNKVTGLESAGPCFWNWIATVRKKAGIKDEGIMLDQQMDGGTVRGTLELTGKTLLMSVNSAARAASGEALVTKAAGDLLKRPLTTIQTVEQMMSEKRPEKAEQRADEIPPEIARQITHDHMDKHYRETLDETLPTLGGKSPRQAVRSPRGRKKVIDWLKLLENRSAEHGDAPIAEYDFGWMWKELGLLEERC